MTTSQIFYQNKQTHTVTTGQQQRSIFRGLTATLAQHQLGARTSCSLLATDINASVVIASDMISIEKHSYSAYGISATIPSSQSLLGYNGEHLSLRNLYLLGNGRRPFSPAIMRFLSPDGISPFGKGGMNCYAYCSNDPINYTDPSGHMQKAQDTALPLTQQLYKILSQRKELEAKEVTLTNQIKENKSEVTKLVKAKNSIPEKYGLYGTVDGVKVKAPERVFAEAKKESVRLEAQAVSKIDARYVLEKELRSVATKYNELSKHLETLQSHIETAHYNNAFDAAEKALSTRSSP